MTKKIKGKHTKTCEFYDVCKREHDCIYRRPCKSFKRKMYRGRSELERGHVGASPMDSRIGRINRMF